jgi:hypothetical protein
VRTPALKRYSINFQTRLAGDFGKLPAGSAGRQALKDYGQLRRAVCVLDDWRQRPCRDIKAADPAGAGR